MLLCIGFIWSCSDSPQDPEIKTNPPKCWDDQIEAEINTTYNNYFTRYGAGWTGGDATYSIPIDATRNLWIFGDTFLGTVNSNRSRPATGLINNSFVIQNGENFTTHYAGSAASPEALLRPAENGWWYWPAHGQMHNGHIQVLMFAMKPLGTSGAWNFQYAAIDLVTLSLPNLEVVSQERIMEYDKINYGACILNDVNYTYIYGSKNTGSAKYLNIARVSGTDLSGTWEFYVGNNTWDTDATKAATQNISVSDQFSVIKKRGSYYLMTQTGYLGKELYLYKSNSPVDTFTARQTIYCTPETGGNIFTYNAFVHDQFSDDDELLISYNNNSSDFNDLFTNADNYRPHFINVTGW